MVDWKAWFAEVKRLAENPKVLNYFILRDLFDSYCDGCSPREAVSLLSGPVSC